MNLQRRYPVGAEVHSGGGTHFRVWAPRRNKVEVVTESGATALEPQPGGYFAGTVPAAPGTLYRFRLDDGDSFPDPVSRFQPQGPHGPSEVIDPDTFEWTDHDWPGVSLEGQVIYEMHIGTFTRAGTWDAARVQLEELARLGITVLEIMPVADFPGRFNWGYDGVGLFAPVALYGRPDDFRRFVNEAHRVGIGVILDVVYNHLGPDGNYIKQFSEDYFTSRYQNEWGEAINFDGENSQPVREWVCVNAAYWAREYHLDGLRLDATQQIFDSSPVNIIVELANTIRSAAGNRKVFIVAENESQHAMLARPVEQGGYGLDGLWNDDFHHSAMVAMTGRNEAYYTDYFGTPAEFVALSKYGFLYQGQRYSWQAKRRGTPTRGMPMWQFVTFLQNHDQIANSGRGDRVHCLTSPGRYRAMSAFLLLGPGTPMLFQGQEFAASSPFHFFADHHPELRALVHEGRIQFLSQFRSLAQLEMRPCFPNPGDPSTFDRCKLDFAEREKHAGVYRLYGDLLRLRREDPCLRPGAAAIDGTVLESESFVLRYFHTTGDDRLLVVNLGRDLRLDSVPYPLLAPPEGKVWHELWYSENPAYGGSGAAPLDTPEGWYIPGHSATVLRPAEHTGKWQI